MPSGGSAGSAESAGAAAFFWAFLGGSANLIFDFWARSLLEYLASCTMPIMLAIVSSLATGRAFAEAVAMAGPEISWTRTSSRPFDMLDDQSSFRAVLVRVLLVL